MSDQKPDEPREYVGDRPYTIAATIVSLIIGLPAAVAAGLLLYGLNRPAIQSGGQVNVTLNALAFPLALVVSGVILAGAVFVLPMRMAKRTGRVLDPNLYPMTGVISVAVLLIGAFVLAILLRII
jgi:hypothetical protein